MNDRGFLEGRTRQVKTRLGRRSSTVNREVESAIAPLVREHPRKSLAAGAAVGLVLGAALKPFTRAGGARSRRGPVSGILGFLRGSVAYALRAKLVNGLTSEAKDEPTSKT